MNEKFKDFQMWIKVFKNIDQIQRFVESMSISNYFESLFRISQELEQSAEWIIASDHRTIWFIRNFQHKTWTKPKKKLFSNQ